MTSTPTLPPELDPRGPGYPSTVGHLQPRSRRAGPARWLRGLAVGTAIAVLAISGGLWAIYARVDGNIERLVGITNGGQDDATTFLIVGSDTREGEGNEDYQGGEGERVSGARSDTTILATFHPDDAGATLVSFPRDAWVTIPAHTARDGNAVGAREARINTAFQDGGPKLLVDTLQELTGQEIDHYIEVDFAGFQQIVEAVDGVTVCLTEPAKDEYSGIDLPAGESRLDGAQALAYVRQRNNLPGGDLDRIGRQQAFLSSVVREVSATGTLLNPLKMTALLDAVSQSIRVDDGLSVDGLKDFALRFRDLTAGQVSFATAPVAGQERIDGKAVLILDDAKLHAMFEGAPAPAPTEETTLDLKAGEISVAVLNGAGIQGLARKAADDLAALGFAIEGAPGNAQTTGATTTIVVHPPDDAEHALTVQSALPGSILQPDPGADGITVVVGRELRTRRGNGSRIPRVRTRADPRAVNGARDIGRVRHRGRDHLHCVTGSPLEFLDRALRADAARPYVTYVDPTAGARVELSGTTLDNWVAKTANLLREEFGLEAGDRAFLAPTHHWLTPVFLLGAWRAGVAVSTVDAQDSAIAVGAADDLSARPELPHDVLALSEHPLGLPGSHGPRIRDFVTEVRGQADRFVPYAAPVPTDVILVTPDGRFTAADLVAEADRRASASGLDRGARILVTTALTSADAIAAGLLAPLAAYGSIVMARNLGEPPDVGLIASERVSHVMAGESPWEIRPLNS